MTRMATLVLWLGSAKQTRDWFYMGKPLEFS